MKSMDWATICAALDQRLDLKYEQLPSGGQIGKRAPASGAPAKKG